MVSAASAVGMAVRLTYLNLIANNGMLPPDVDLFDPLEHGTVDVPVLPNITFQFARAGDGYMDYYDFYFFSLTQSVCNGSLNYTEALYDDIFELTSVILWPLTSPDEVNKKIWPNGSEGPKRNYCLFAICHESDTLTWIILMTVQISCGIAFTTMVGLFFSHHQRSMRLNRGHNKLVLYPDDVSIEKPVSKRTQLQVSVAQEQWLMPCITPTTDADNKDEKSVKSDESVAEDAAIKCSGMVTYNVSLIRRLLLYTIEGQNIHII
ncbi:unnamed protein product [Dibothriocephalus latus]|uniref:Uncharacterized protein n=1 Tax=Dibothriocephalus latus TaxID=60516 RepID=A0A3P7LS29_DIBLA|nr:unnamed protein product [Dibothriocephalus latus]